MAQTVLVNGVYYVKENGKLYTLAEWQGGVATPALKVGPNGSVATSADVHTASADKVRDVKSPKWARAPKGTPRT